MKIKSMLDYDLETGIMKTENIASILISRGMIAEIQQQFEKIIGPISERIIYISGKDSVQQSIKECVNPTFLKLVGKKKKLEMLISGANRYGWGVFKLEEFDDKTPKVIITVSNSFIAKNYQKSSKPVCHLIRGVLAGFCSLALNKDMDCEEIECIARGDKICKFVISSS